eukprot:TRINITY_DN22132_c0_g1_i1.p1 TRINITY_DN22132_c0_g1~~TRINITY_DN22132_c0_g1_i1.p1  ORF type:complete len:407 (-),score=96.07 TRINITY_DN22132_c0_g1_i1:75-1295(-)
MTLLFFAAIAADVLAAAMASKPSRAHAGAAASMQLDEVARASLIGGKDRVADHGSQSDAANGLMRRAASDRASDLSTANAHGSVDGHCENPPCCPADGCVFPFTYHGVTYTDCTSDFVEGKFWCGKEKDMTNESRWAWCVQGECSSTSHGVQNESEASSTEVGCKAPVGIEDAAIVSCAEGGSVPLGGWCTPKCAQGKLPLIRLHGSVANDACPHPESNWGAKLCCHDGVLQPRSAFECVDDLFGTMDTNDDGQLSRREYESYTGRSIVNSKMAEAEQKAVEILQDAKEQAEASGVSGQSVKKVETDEEDPVVWYYLLVATAILIIAAAASMIWLWRHYQQRHIEGEDTWKLDLVGARSPQAQTPPEAPEGEAAAAAAAAAAEGTEAPAGAAKAAEESAAKAEDNK